MRDDEEKVEEEKEEVVEEEAEPATEQPFSCQSLVLKFTRLFFMV